MTLGSKLRQLVEVARDPRYISFYIQRQVTDPARRERMAERAARRRPPSPPLEPSMAGHIASLRTEGIALLGELLTSAQCDELVAHFEAMPVKDPYRRELPAFLPNGARPCTETHVAFYEPHEVLGAPHLLALANRPELLSLASAFLGCKPTIGYLACWWSFATGMAAQQAENFHRDLDDWRFVKLFVYLTDVGEGQGPHIYVSRSAEDTQLRHIRRYSDAEVAAAYPTDDIRALTGPRGGGFMENTVGMHKGQPVRAGRRLMFQAVYSVQPLPYGPRAPVHTMALQKKPLDSYINRVYIK
jgi:hypothetical protein